MPKMTSGPFYIPLLTLLFLVVVSIMTTMAINSIEQETKQLIRESLQAVLQTTINSYQTSINFRKRDVQELSMTPALIDLTRKLLNTQGAQHKVLNPLRDFMAPILSKEMDLGFFIISAQRINIASQRDANLNKTNLIHLQRPEYLDRAFNGESLFIPTLLSDVPLPGSHASHVQSPLTIFVVAPIRHEQQVIAVLALRINLNAFFSHVKLGRLGGSGETYAFDKGGMLITKSRFDHQLKRIGLIASDELGILNVRISDPGGNLLEGHVPSQPSGKRPLTLMAQSATAGHSGFNVDGYRDYRGVPVFGAWLWNQDLGFGITTEVDVDEAMRPFYRTRRMLIWVLLVTVFMALSLLSYASRIQRAKKRELLQLHGTLEQRVAQRTAELNEARNALQVANGELQVLATTDGLTNLANRRCFDVHFENEWLRCRRERNSLGIILFDIDYFKNYNDHYGHTQGDECLRRIALLLREFHVTRRPGDLIARYGGEEFVIVLSNPTIESVSQLAEQLRHQVCQLEIEHQASQLSEKILTVSIGYAVETDLNLISPLTLLNRADAALYQAKALGRNQICEGRVDQEDNFTGADGQ